MCKGFKVGRIFFIFKGLGRLFVCFCFGLYYVLFVSTDLVYRFFGFLVA